MLIIQLCLSSLSLSLPLDTDLSFNISICPFPPFPFPNARNRGYQLLKCSHRYIYRHGKILTTNRSTSTWFGRVPFSLAGGWSSLFGGHVQSILRLGWVGNASVCILSSLLGKLFNPGQWVLLGGGGVVTLMWELVFHPLYFWEIKKAKCYSVIHKDGRFWWNNWSAWDLKSIIH